MHVDKFARTAVGHMLKHYSRDAAHFGNEQIDRSRSCFNYNLAPDREKADIDYYKERLSKVKCQKRADVKTLCDWIITLPKVDFTEREEARFFQEAYQFMARDMANRMLSLHGFIKMRQDKHICTLLYSGVLG